MKNYLNKIFKLFFTKIKKETGGEQNKRENFSRKENQNRNEEFFFLDSASLVSKEHSESFCVDMYEEEDKIVIRAALPGVDYKDINVSFSDDIITIEAIPKNRKKDVNYFYQEVYRNKFFRSLVIPYEIERNKVNAVYKNGILTLEMSKLNKREDIKINIAYEED